MTTGTHVIPYFSQTWCRIWKSQLSELAFNWTVTCFLPLACITVLHLYSFSLILNVISKLFSVVYITLQAMNGSNLAKNVNFWQSTESKFRFLLR